MLARAATAEPFDVGDYLTDESALYRVERFERELVWLEDARSGLLHPLSVVQARKMRVVVPDRGGVLVSG